MEILILLPISLLIFLIGFRFIAGEKIHYIKKPRFTTKCPYIKNNIVGFDCLFCNYQLRSFNRLFYSNYEICTYKFEHKK